MESDEAVSERNESEAKYPIEIDHIGYVHTCKSGYVITIPRGDQFILQTGSARSDESCGRYNQSIGGSTIDRISISRR